MTANRALAESIRNYIESGVDLLLTDNDYRTIIKALEQEPQTGHWVGIDEEPHEDYECDKCGYVVSTYTANIEPHTEYKFCPNCGCRMVEPQEISDRNLKMWEELFKAESEERDV